VEALPFEAGAFDLVASQFGIEYCESRLAIPELARVAAPGAHLALVLHHAGSRLADVAQTEAASIAWLLAEDGPLAATATIYPYLAMSAAGQQARLAADDGATRARDQLNNTMQALVERSEQSAYPDILFEARDFLAAQIQGIMQRRQTLEQVRQAHAAWVDQLEAAAFRHRELCTHALDATAARDLVDVFTGEGFEAMDLQPLHQDAYLIGWRLTGIRGS
jgi:SAM-dependent methyltransferase